MAEPAPEAALAIDQDDVVAFDADFEARVGRAPWRAVGGLREVAHHAEGTSTRSGFGHRRARAAGGLGELAAPALAFDPDLERGTVVDEFEVLERQAQGGVALPQGLAQRGGDGGMIEGGLRMLGLFDSALNELEATVHAAPVDEALRIDPACRKRDAASQVQPVLAQRQGTLEGGAVRCLSLGWWRLRVCQCGCEQARGHTQQHDAGDAARHGHAVDPEPSGATMAKCRCRQEHVLDTS